VEFENTFTVDAPIERVWTHLLDVQAVAPCVPGAELTEVVGDREFKGTVKIKLGAVQVAYKGSLVMTDVDEAARRVVLVASGSETRGSGSASGTVTSTLTEDAPGRTTVLIVSEVNVTGRVAQFGRNIMQDVSTRLTKQFADCLQASLETQPEGETNEPTELTSKAELAVQIPPAVRSEPASQVQGGELKILPVLVDVARSRTAEGLRALARIIQPEE